MPAILHPPSSPCAIGTNFAKSWCSRCPREASVCSGAQQCSRSCSRMAIKQGSVAQDKPHWEQTMDSNYERHCTGSLCKSLNSPDEDEEYIRLRYHHMLDTHIHLPRNAGPSASEVASVLLFERCGSLRSTVSSPHKHQLERSGLEFRHPQRSHAHLFTQAIIGDRNCSVNSTERCTLTQWIACAHTQVLLCLLEQT